MRWVQKDNHGPRPQACEDVETNAPPAQTGEQHSAQPDQEFPLRPAHLRVPDLGVGVGLRVPHYAHVLEHQPAMGFFEVISENFLGGGKPRYHLQRFCEQYSVILHGVSLNIGAPEEPDRSYLQRLKELVRLVKPAWVSDHFCFTGVGNAHMHDLLPLPLTSELVARVARRARMVQDFLEVPFGLENTSSYLTYRASTMTEWEFVTEAIERADCGLMFDVNNVYVSAYNGGFDPLEYLANIPYERILQVHIAGHTNYGSHIIDTHVGPLIEPVLDLYRETVRRAGPISTLLEWDAHIPTFDRLREEADRVALVRGEGLSADAPVLSGDVVVRQTGAPSDLQQGALELQAGGGDSLSAWQVSPGSDALPAERLE